MEYFPCTSFGIAASTSIQSDREVKEKKNTYSKVFSILPFLWLILNGNWTREVTKNTNTLVILLAHIQYASFAK